MSLSLLLGVCLILTTARFELEPPAAAMPPLIRPGRVLLHKLLASDIETKDLTDSMPLKQALQYLYQKFQARGVDLPLFVDIKAFRAEDEKRPNGPYDDEVKLPSVPRQMPFAQALRLILSQLKNPNGTFVIRDGVIWITTRKQATLPARMRELLVARFDKTPLTAVAEKLSDQAGATIVIDPRLKENANLPITAEFCGDVTLLAALTTVADMADARVVHLDNCLYVTTQANADALERRMRDREKESRTQHRDPPAPKKPG